jgi:hypothetical protein
MRGQKKEQSYWCRRMSNSSWGIETNGSDQPHCFWYVLQRQLSAAEASILKKLRNLAGRKKDDIPLYNYLHLRQLHYDIYNDNYQIHLECFIETHVGAMVGGQVALSDSLRDVPLLLNSSSW